MILETSTWNKTLKIIQYNALQMSPIQAFQGVFG